MHIQVERAILSWLVKDWRHTPYASLIMLYANHFIGSVPRTLLHKDPAVILVRNILGSASKDSWPARMSERAAKIVGYIWSKGHALSPNALVYLCDTMHPSALPLFRNHFTALIRRLQQHQEQGRPEDQDGVHHIITTIFGRLLELPWESRDYAVVSALFAHMREEGIPPTSRTAYEGVIRSEFALFGKVSRSKSSKETITARTLGGRAT